MDMDKNRISDRIQDALRDAVILDNDDDPAVILPFSFHSFEIEIGFMVKMNGAFDVFNFLCILTTDDVKPTIAYINVTSTPAIAMHLSMLISETKVMIVFDLTGTYFAEAMKCGEPSADSILSLLNQHDFLNN